MKTRNRHKCINLSLSQKQALVFTCLQYKSFENTAGKGEIARNEQFLLFPQCFVSGWIIFCHFHQFKIVVCKLFSVWKSLKFVVWERVIQYNQLLDNKPSVYPGRALVKER